MRFSPSAIAVNNVCIQQGLEGFGGPGDLITPGATNEVLTPLYRESDSRYLFQDINGTEPVTAVGDYVALALDRSQGLRATSSDTSLPISERFAGLGTDLITDGVVSDPGNWVVANGATATGGALNFAGTNQLASQDFGLALGEAQRAGDFYVIEFDVSGYSAGNLNVKVGNSAVYADLASGNGSYCAVVSADDNIRILRFQSAAGGTFSVDNIKLRRLPGNHAYQTVDLDRVRWGRKPVGVIRNLLQDTVNYSDCTAINGASLSVSDEVITVSNFDGAGVSDRVRIPAGAVSVVATETYTGSFKIRGSGVDIGKLVRAFVKRNVGTFVATDALITLTEDWQEVEITLTTLADTVGAILTFQNTASNSASGFEVKDVQFELGSTATNYQRVAADYDITESGKRTVYGLYLNGANQYLRTADIDLSGTDNVTLATASYITGASTVAGAVAGFGWISDSGAISNYVNTSGEYVVFSRGNSTAFLSLSPSAALNEPVAIVTRSDISSDRLDSQGTFTGSSADNQGAGNFGSHPLFIGAREGAPAAGFLKGFTHFIQLLNREISNDDADNLSELVKTAAGDES